MDKLTLLEKGDTRLGILTEAGGRPVFLSSNQSPNLLQADAELWDNAATIGRESFDNHQWTGFNGHIMWIGPQVDFWNDQDLRPEDRGEPWPPDPYLTLLPYEIDASTDDSIRLTSPDSPVSGLRLQNQVELIAEGKIHLKTVATNIRETPVTKDLWSNTRVSPDDRFFVPASKQAVRIDLLGQQALPTEYEQGFFRFDIDNLTGDSAWSNKAFISPRLPYIAKFCGNQVFIKRFEAFPTEQIHPEQGAVEIYLDLPHGDNPGLLELEAHGPLLTLAPGESMSWKESWILLPYEGEDSAPAQRAFLINWEKQAFAKQSQ